MAQRESGQERLRRMTRIDLELLEQGYLLVGGVDEAGRGPWPARWWPPAR